MVSAWETQHDRTAYGHPHHRICRHWPRPLLRHDARRPWGRGNPHRPPRRLHGPARSAVARPDVDRARHEKPPGRRHRARSVQERRRHHRSEEHTSELQSLMRISYAVFCLKKKKENKIKTYTSYYIT